tara:strand:+ start:3921 stop:4106 length:186 start_codon:yes stop_codon:yes gene_type:complete
MAKEFANLHEVHKKVDNKLNVKDTDFLLKLIMRSTFEGAELEVAYSVLTKLAEMHKVNLEG